MTLPGLPIDLAETDISILRLVVVDSSLVRRRKRDVYGNWVWEDVDVDAKSRETEDRHSGRVAIDSYDEGTPVLEWRDYFALVIASLETFLLPFVVLILLLFGMIVVFAILK